jgi:predicted nucleic acid-binding protein
MDGIQGRGTSAKPALVFNSTPLIYLAKAGLVGKLNRLPFKLLTTREVYSEVVVKGIEKRVVEAKELGNAFDSHTIEAMENTNEDVVRKLRNSGVHRGEATVISLACKLDAIAIIDDKRARHVATALGVKVSGTPHVIIQLVKQGGLTRQEARRSIDRIVKEGWFCSVRSYSEIIEAIEKA